MSQPGLLLVQKFKTFLCFQSVLMPYKIRFHSMLVSYKITSYISCKYLISVNIVFLIIPCVMRIDLFLCAVLNRDKVRVIHICVQL